MVSGEIFSRSAKLHQGIADRRLAEAELQGQFGAREHGAGRELHRDDGFAQAFEYLRCGVARSVELMLLRWRRAVHGIRDPGRLGNKSNKASGGARQSRAVNIRPDDDKCLKDKAR